MIRLSAREASILTCIAGSDSTILKRKKIPQLMMDMLSKEGQKIAIALLGKKSSKRATEAAASIKKWTDSNREAARERMKRRFAGLET